MPFNITTVEFFKWPLRDPVVDERLALFQTNTSELEERIKQHIFDRKSGKRVPFLFE